MPGRPNPKGMSQALSHLLQCSRQNNTTIDPNNNFLFLVTGEKNFQYFAKAGSTFPTASYPRPERPPDFPTYTDDMTAGARARVEAEFNFKKGQYEECDNMNKSLITRLLQLIPDVYHKQYHEWEAKNINPSFFDAYSWFYHTYASNTQAEHRLQAGQEVTEYRWIPADGLEPLIGVLNEKRDFFIFNNNPKTDEQLTDWLLLHLT